MSLAVVKLRTCLDQCSLGLLRQIAASHGLVLPELVARADLVDLVQARFQTPGYLASRLQNLDDGRRRALLLVAAEGGQLRGYVLQRRLRPRTPDEILESANQHPVSALCGEGLLFRTFQAVGPDRGEVFVIPDELLELLPSDNRAGGPEIRAVEQPDERLHCSPAFNLFAMASFIRRWRQREHRPSAAEGQLAALSRETAQLAAELPERSPRERWTLLAHLGLRLGLFAREEGGLHPTERFETWLSQGELAERRLWDSYVNAEQWNDLERSGSGRERFAGRTAGPAVARGQVLEFLRDLPRDAWVLVDDVQHLIRERAPDFLREGFEVATARLVDLQSGEVLGGEGSWERVEGPLVHYLLSGPLFWLGVVEWGRSLDHWDRLRVTAMGRAWLSGSEEVLEPLREPFSLTTDRHLLANERSNLALLWRLEPYLKLEQRGPPSRYSLSRMSYGRGLQAGGTSDELRRLLERAAGGALPAGWSQAIERWAGRAGRLRIRPAVLLTATDSEELDRLLSRSDLAPLVRERLGPCAAALVPAHSGEVAEVLERLGLLPELDGALRLMAGRRAYAALVDQHVLDGLLFCLRFLKALRPELLAEIPESDRLVQRLEQALGPITAPKIARRAQAAARRTRRDLSGQSR